jgi:hypothetical protein
LNAKKTYIHIDDLPETQVRLGNTHEQSFDFKCNFLISLLKNLPELIFGQQVLQTVDVGKNLLLKNTMDKGLSGK